MKLEDLWKLKFSIETNPFKDELFFKHSCSYVSMNDVLKIVDELLKGVTDFWDCDYPFIRIVAEILNLEWRLVCESYSDSKYFISLEN